MRTTVVVLVLLVIVGGLAGLKWAQLATLMEAGEMAAELGPPPESVSTELSRELAWESSLSAIGSIVAARGVSVSNDAPGLVTRIEFESGDTVRRGELLLELDTSVERAQLTTAQAQQQLSQQNFARTRALTEGGGLAPSQLDADAAQLASSNAQVLALQAQINRKRVRAPFSGKLGIRQVNLGQYLSPGSSVTSLESLDWLFVDFALPQQALPSLQPGLPVRVVIEGQGPRAAEGTITAIAPTIDAATRTIQVRASVQNTQQILSPGMFARVSVLLPGKALVVAVPSTAIVHAPYGDSLFVVSPPDSERPEQAAMARALPRRARQQFVRLGEERGDFVAVLEGLDAGREVVTSGAFKLRSGASILVNNSVRPTPQVNPRPENR